MSYDTYYVLGPIDQLFTDPLRIIGVSYRKHCLLRLWGFLSLACDSPSPFSPPWVSLSPLSCPFPFPSLRAAVFGGDYAVLTLEYELGKSSSQILELGKAGGRQGSKNGWDICVAAAPDA